MTDDDLIAGAAVPTRTRWIRSAARLDVVWVLATACALLTSSLFVLVDLRDLRIHTGAAPLRVFVVGLPLLAIAIGSVAAWRRRELLAAVATGVLAPGVALAGSLSIGLFLDDASAFTDIGVAVSLAAGLLGAVMLVRWLVYHPVSLLGDEPRPSRPLSLVLVGVGAVLAIFVVVTGWGDGVGAAWVASTVGMLTVPLVLVVCGLVRTVPAAALATGAAVAQLAAVGMMRADVTKQEAFDVSIDSDAALRTGVVGLIGLGVAAGLAVAAALRAEPDDREVEIEDEASWRWSADD